MTIPMKRFFTITWRRTLKFTCCANAKIAGTPSAGTHKDEVVPQIWSYEQHRPGGQPARAFVWMQGHNYANFANEQIQRTLFRGIAWAAKETSG